MAYPVSKIVVPPIYKLWIRKVKGIGNIPHDKPFIVAINHSSYYDILIMPCILVPKLNKKMHTLVNSSYWKNPITKFFLDLWGGIPVFVKNENDSKQKNKLALERALNHINHGDIIMIFPEGTRSLDGKLQKAKTGVARLALLSKAPVLPVGIIGSYKVLPKGNFFPRFARCEVKIGKLMSFERYLNKKTSNKVYEKITKDIMKQIAKLIGQKYNY